MPKAGPTGSCLGSKAVGRNRSRFVNGRRFTPTVRRYVSTVSSTATRTTRRPLPPPSSQEVKRLNNDLLVTHSSTPVTIIAARASACRYVCGCGPRRALPGARAHGVRDELVLETRRRRETVANLRMRIRSPPAPSAVSAECPPPAHAPAPTYMLSCFFTR